jgi:hypothetical protein
VTAYPGWRHREDCVPYFLFPTTTGRRFNRVREIRRILILLLPFLTARSLAKALSQLPVTIARLAN